MMFLVTIENASHLLNKHRGERNVRITATCYEGQFSSEESRTLIGVVKPFLMKLTAEDKAAVKLSGGTWGSIDKKIHMVSACSRPQSLSSPLIHPDNRVRGREYSANRGGLHAHRHDPLFSNLRV